MGQSGRHELAKAGKLQSYELDRRDPKTQRKARKEASTDENALDKRRLAYQQEGMVLNRIIETMQELRAESLKLGAAIREIERVQLTENKPEHGKAALEKLRNELRVKDEEYQDCYNIASLKSLKILFEGQALMIDMLSAERWEMNRETDTREYWRVSAAELLSDTSEAMDELVRKMNRITRMINHLGVAGQHWHAGAFIPLKDGREIDEDAEEGEQETESIELSAPAGTGVPAEDLKMSREKVIQLVRGEEKK